MKLYCPNCDTPIPASSINVEQAIAVCPNCDEVFPFGDSLPTRKPKDERKVKAPKRFRVEETPDGVLIESKLLPEQPVAKGGLVVGYAVMVFLALNLTLLLTVFLAGFTGSAAMGIFLAFTALIVLLIYTVVAGITAKRHVMVDQDNVQVRFRPLLLRPTRKFRREDIVAVIPQAVATGVGSYRQRIFDVDVRLRDGSQHVFLSRIPGDEAAFIAQELNRVLFQQDAPPTMDVLVEDTGDQVLFDRLSEETAQEQSRRS